MAHPPRIPVWLRSERSVIYLVTLCVASREPVLANQQTLIALRNTAARLEQWKILAAVIMPDHLHLIITPANDRNANVGDCSAALKRWIRQELKASWHWQPGCFDRLLRNEDSPQNKWPYLQENPVRAGLVKCAQDWPYQIGFEDWSD
jgi:REP-associated tyrosine transposase